MMLRSQNPPHLPAADEKIERVKTIRSEVRSDEVASGDQRRVRAVGKLVHGSWLVAVREFGFSAGPLQLLTATLSPRLLQAAVVQ